LSLQQLENPVISDRLDLLIAIKDLNFSMFEERRVTDHVPESAFIFLVGRPTLGTHPATFIAERSVEFAKNKIVAGVVGRRVAANVHNIGGTEGLTALRVGWNETHPPPFAIPRGDVAGGEQQIAADKDASTSPKRSAIVVVCTDPNFSNGAVRPHVRALVEIVFEGMLDRVVVIGFELADEFLILGLGGVLWPVLFGDWRFSARETSWFMALGNFETMFQTSLDFSGIETALSFAGATRFSFGATLTCAMVFIAVVHHWAVLGNFVELILTWFGKRRGCLGHYRLVR
jgi:hypothetical protein